MNLPFDLFYKIIYALGIGILMGLERSLVPPLTQDTQASDRHLDEKQGPYPPDDPPDIILGVRTFSILSLGGFTAALIGDTYTLVAPVIVIGLVACIVVMYWRACHEDPGITTEIAAVTCCGLGVLCYINPHAAGVLALLATILLAMKPVMAKTLMRLKRVELTDTLKLLVIIIIVLPMLPNKDLDPYGAFNPYKVTFLVILICGISFVGYFLTKFLGAHKGLGLTGLFGGLTSSTAVTAAMSVEAKKSPGLLYPCAVATVIANATMFGRVLVVVTILDRPLLANLVWSIGTMMCVAVCSVIYLWYLSKNVETSASVDASSDISLKNPFSLGPAIKFSIFFIAILFVAKVAKIQFGDKGLYLASMVSGLADVDAITLSIAQQTGSAQLAYATGAIGITIAVVANSLVKSIIALYSGGWQFGWRVGAVLMGATAAGLGVLLIV